MFFEDLGLWFLLCVVNLSNRGSNYLLNELCLSLFVVNVLAVSVCLWSWWQISHWTGLYQNILAWFLKHVVRLCVIVWELWRLQLSLNRLRHHSWLQNCLRNLCLLLLLVMLIVNFSKEAWLMHMFWLDCTHNYELLIWLAIWDIKLFDTLRYTVRSQLLPIFGLGLAILFLKFFLC